MDQPQVTLHEPYNGYTTGTMTGTRDGLKYEIVLYPSGKSIYLYLDEFTIND